jgi:putative effector of murein hydrolase LrgA (UPF0299 family)
MMLAGAHRFAFLDLHKQQLFGILFKADISFILMIGFCAWIVYCAIRHGYAVG